MAKKENWEIKFETYKLGETTIDAELLQLENDWEVTKADYRDKLAHVTDPKSPEYKKVSSERRKAEKEYQSKKKSFEEVKEKYAIIKKNESKILKAKENRDKYQEELDKHLATQAESQKKLLERKRLSDEAKALEEQLAELKYNEEHLNYALKNPIVKEERKAEIIALKKKNLEEQNANHEAFAENQKALSKHLNDTIEYVSEEEIEDLKAEVEKWDLTCEMLVEGKSMGEIQETLVTEGKTKNKPKSKPQPIIETADEQEEQETENGNKDEDEIEEQEAENDNKDEDQIEEQAENGDKDEDEIEEQEPENENKNEGETEEQKDEKDSDDLFDELMDLINNPPDEFKSETKTDTQTDKNKPETKTDDETDKNNQEIQERYQKLLQNLGNLKNQPIESLVINAYEIFDLLDIKTPGQSAVRKIEDGIYGYYYLGETLTYTEKVEEEIEKIKEEKDGKEGMLRFFVKVVETFDIIDEIKDGQITKEQKIQLLQKVKEGLELDKQQTETKSETKPETKSETKPEIKSGTKPETKPETKSGTKPETKPEIKPETKPEDEHQKDLVNIKFNANKEKYLLLINGKYNKDLSKSIAELENSQEFKDFKDVAFNYYIGQLGINSKQIKNADPYVAYMLHQVDKKFGGDVRLSNYMRAVAKLDEKSKFTTISYDVNGIFGKGFEEKLSNEILKHANWHSKNNLADLKEKTAFTTFMEKHENFRAIYQFFANIADVKKFKTNKKQKALPAGSDKEQNVKQNKSKDTAKKEQKSFKERYKVVKKQLKNKANTMIDSIDDGITKLKPKKKANLKAKQKNVKVNEKPQGKPVKRDEKGYIIVEAEEIG